MEQSEFVLGADVAKNWIDVVGPNGHERVDNDGLKAFALRIAKQGGRVAFEASGGYETPLRMALAEVSVPAIRINPRRARAFATSLGRLARAKTDLTESVRRFSRQASHWRNCVFRFVCDAD
ncbi:MAG: hypothetical protein AAF700_15945 [Pseudomonadota bacterium]